MRIYLLGVLTIWVLASGHAQAQQPAPTGIEALTSNGVAELQGLSQQRVHKLGNHRKLARYMELRRNSLNGALPAPNLDIVHYARKSLGIRYKRDSKSQALLEADCVTWTERVVSLALTDSWEDAYRLQRRLRYEGGNDTDFANVNHYPIADWLTNNGWLLEDVSAQLGGTLEPLNIVTDRQAKFLEIEVSSNTYASGTGALVSPVGIDGFGVSMITSYVFAETIKDTFDSLQSGDVVFFIGNNLDRSERVRRPRCFHMGVIEKDGLSVNLLHCRPPMASATELARYVQYGIARDNFLGIKVARIRSGARQLVRDELARATIESQSPLKQDLKLGIMGVAVDGTQFVPPSRIPDVELEIDGIVYGGIDLRSRDSLHSLLGNRWAYVYDLPINTRFRIANPDPMNVRCLGCDPEDVESSRIFVPLRNASDSESLILLPSPNVDSENESIGGAVGGSAPAGATSTDEVVTPSRDPDVQITREGVLYGGIDIVEGDSLYALFGVDWQTVYNLDINVRFRAANPNPNRLIQAIASSETTDRRIYYAIDDAQP